MKRHTESGAEVYLLAVEPAFHGKGVGSALLGMAELDLAADGFQFLQVKTLGPSEGDPFYERTRGFYERRGFVQLEEIKDFWDDEPALILVKQLLASANPTIAAGTSPPRLIHLNGPSGVGKSTIAQQYADRNPGVLNLDLDLLRPLVGGWRHDFESTGSLTRILGLDMATTHLRTGRDVVVPQLVARLDELVPIRGSGPDGGSSLRRGDGHCRSRGGGRETPPPWLGPCCPMSSPRCISNWKAPARSRQPKTSKPASTPSMPSDLDC